MQEEKFITWINEWPAVRSARLTAFWNRWMGGFTLRPPLTPTHSWVRKSHPC